MTHPSVTTPTAVLEAVSASVRLLCFKAGAVVDTAAIAGNVAAGHELPDCRAVIMYVPENATFTFDMLDRDHPERLGFAESTWFLALVVEDALLRQAAELYLTHHPPVFRYKVVDHMHAAREWVRMMLQEAMSV